MRTWVLLLAFGLLATSAAATNNSKGARTLIGNNAEKGGFGGPALKLSDIGGDSALFVGGRGGWILDHKFVIGGAGYGLASEIQGRRASERLDLGYGGVFFEFVASSEQLVHFSSDVLFGAGGASYSTDEFLERGDSEATSFFVVEPGLHMTLNVTTNFRIGVGATYRVISGTKLSAHDDHDLSGFTGTVSFNFGSF